MSWLTLTTPTPNCESVMPPTAAWMFVLHGRSVWAAWVLRVSLPGLYRDLRTGLAKFGAT